MTTSSPPGRVLVVDDSELVLMLVCDELEQQGFVVRSAQSGADALVELPRFEPEVVVCDLHMPDMSGFDVLARVRAFDDTLPVVILSGDADLGAVLAAVRQGAFDYVLKSGEDLGPLVAAVERAAAHMRVLRDNQRLSAALQEANEILAQGMDELEERSNALEREVQERRRIESELEIARDHALEASRAKSSFLASMSREMRVPLTAILGYSEILIEESGALGHDGLTEDLQKIQGAGRHLLAVIGDILDLAKLEARKTVIYSEDFELAGLVQGIVGEIHPLVKANNNEMRVHIAPEIGSMRADQALVRQALFKLLNYVCTYVEYGLITLSVKLEPGDVPFDDEFIFEVEDTGEGLTSRQLTRLFLPFSQPSPFRAQEHGGTGLDLAIVYTIAQRMGGEIVASSELGRGSRFRMTLPAMVASEAAHMSIF